MQENIFCSTVFTGFSFLGWRFLYLKNRLLVGVVSRFAIRVHKLNLKNLIKSFTLIRIFSLIRRLNYIIIYWLNNYSFSYSLWDISGELDVYLHRLLWNFVKRRHSRKNNAWIYAKYWKFLMGKFHFYFSDLVYGNIYFLKSHYFTKSKIYSLPSSINVFLINDLCKLNELWFKKISIKFFGVYKVLCVNQYGICPFCGGLLGTMSFLKLKLLKVLFPIRLLSGKLSRVILVHFDCSYYMQSSI